VKELIKKLVEAWGPSGFEHHIRALIQEEVKDLCDEMRVDNLGNLICRVGQKTEGKGIRVMVAAHMDEIGLMVSHIDKKGFLRFTNIGGLFPVTLAGNRVKFENGVIGVIGMEKFWSTRREAPSLEGFYIDISESTDAEGNQTNAAIKVGDVATMWRSMEERGNRIISKTMDDRIGCVVAIEAMRKLKQSGTPNEVYFAFTTQEEVGVRGARPAAYSIDPDFAIALDVTPTNDVPKSDNICSVELGKGAAIKMQDTGLVTPPGVRNLMIETAQKYNIAYQFEVLTGGSTDASGIQLMRSGVPSGCISIPCRFVHTVSETVDIQDVQASIDLLAAIIANPIEGVKPV
jgi:endoglucanase